MAEWTYLDTASFGQLPRIASDAVLRHLTHRDETGSTRFLSWFDDMDAIRELCAKLVNAAASDIAFVPSASTGLAFLIQGLDWNPGDEVLSLEGEFPNQIYQSSRQVPWNEFHAAVNERTRVVAMSTVNYATGFRPPILEIAKFLREREIIFFLDGTQSVGALQIDVQSVRPSMLCVDAYKWMVSPNGAGFLYVDPELRKHLKPTVVGWRSDAGWRNVASLNHGSPVFPESAEKYEGGMLPFASLYAMGAVIEWMLQAGPAAIEARVLGLASRTRALLAEMGADVNSDDSQIVTAKIPNLDSSELARKLRAQKIVISARHGRLRISPHYYNNEADLQALRLGLHAAT